MIMFSFAHCRPLFCNRNQRAQSIDDALYVDALAARVTMLLFKESRRLSLQLDKV